MVEGTRSLLKDAILSNRRWALQAPMNQGGLPKLRSDLSGPTPFLCGTFFTERRHSEYSAVGLTGSYESGRIAQAEVRPKCANSILVRGRSGAGLGPVWACLGWSGAGPSCSGAAQGRSGPVWGRCEPVTACSGPVTRRNSELRACYTP